MMILGICMIFGIVEKKINSKKYILKKEGDTVKEMK